MRSLRDDRRSHAGRSGAGALNFITTAQCRDGGWRYTPRQPSGGDTSVVGWQVMALKSGYMGHLMVPPQSDPRFDVVLGQSAIQQRIDLRLRQAVNIASARDHGRGTAVPHVHRLGQDTSWESSKGSKTSANRGSARVIFTTTTTPPRSCVSMVAGLGTSSMSSCEICWSGPRIKKPAPKEAGSSKWAVTRPQQAGFAARRSRR